MGDYKKVVEHLEGTAPYTSPALGDFEAVTHLARVAVVGPEQESVWERTVRDRIISLAIPLPFFDKRLGRIATRADALVESLNTSQAKL